MAFILYLSRVATDSEETFDVRESLWQAILWQLGVSDLSNKKTSLFRVSFDNTSHVRNAP